MKGLALVLLVVASASAKGSGPYLPSGWRPQGPAFYLPSEIVKPSTEAPVKDLTLQGSEASGSDFLQEYGPPKAQEVTQNLISQGLPDVSTELNFSGIQNFPPIVEVAQEQIAEGSFDSLNILKTTTDSEEMSHEKNPQENLKPEVTSTEQSEAATESQASVEVNPVTSAEVAPVDVEDVDTTAANVEPTTELSSASVSSESQQESSTVVSEAEAVTTSAVEATSEDLLANLAPAVNAEVNENVQNIPAIIASLEQEILTQQAEVNQAVSELAVQDVSGALQQAPEGFLEYGPPGFTEYGPPKGEEVVQPLASNEARRRRFSPKFRPARKH